jgi:phosphoribosyl-AMP cyclohydrolase / phosphoribosyl-ATP pyrophosphohydrolase
VSENIRLSAVKFGADGLVPVVTQESRSGDILMVAFANRDALDRTLSTGLAHYFSRSRGALWQKGETSGHIQRVTEVRLDCDGDTVLYRVEQTGPACHTGTRTCFSTVIGRAGGQTDGGAAEEDPGGHLLSRLARTIAQRAADRPAGSYTVQLLAGGVSKASQKVGEEAVEVVVAANSEDDERLASEAADLLYHLLVLLQARGVPFDTVLRELESRTK